MLWLVKIFKAKYFPREGFVEVKVGNNPSFIWRSIWSPQNFLKAGLRWKIRDGSSIRVWGEKWLRNDINPLLETPFSAELARLRVNVLFIPGHQEWDVELL